MSSLPPYSYSPQALVENFGKLKAQEDAALVQPKPKDEDDNNKTLRPPHSTPPTSDAIIVAAVQLTASGIAESQVHDFWARAQAAIIQAVTEHDAHLVLLPELFLGPSFCQSQDASLMKLACPVEESFVIAKLQRLAKTYQVVLPVSIFERSENVLYNTVVMMDADGSILGKYRKSHIPDGTGYQEKFYFTPGDSGFRVWKSNVLKMKIGVAICWDQWFPEAARSMALLGADVLLYPTAIGSEPQDPSLNSADHWQRVMQGHAAANMIPVVASNRVGTEILLSEKNNDVNIQTEQQRITFYGRSFITDETGAIVTEASSKEGTTNNGKFSILTTTIRPETNRSTRLAWGLFRDRRPDLYGILQTKDGQKQQHQI